jgi:hypothetical protein
MYINLIAYGLVTISVSAGLTLFVLDLIFNTGEDEEDV